MIERRQFLTAAATMPFLAVLPVETAVAPDREIIIGGVPIVLNPEWPGPTQPPETMAKIVALIDSTEFQPPLSNPEAKGANS